MSQIGHRTRAEAAQKAEELELVCIEATRYELLIDLDSGVIHKGIVEALGKNGFEMDSRCLVTTSKSGNKHVYIRLIKPILSHSYRIVMQATIGSDPMREALTLCRVKEQSEAPIVLFETAEFAERVQEWRQQFSKVSAYTDLRTMDIEAQL